jgi:small subunit ribosomal protein S20
MANIKSQVKRNRQNEAARARNKSYKSEIKTRSRRALDAAAGGDAAAAEEALRLAQKRIDKAASKGVIHRRTAARRKARLAKQVRGRLD